MLNILLNARKAICAPIAASLSPNPPDSIGVNAKSGYLSKKMSAKSQDYRVVEAVSYIHSQSEENLRRNDHRTQAQ